MENIKDHIEERLWNFIKRNYNSENYSNAILDSTQFIGDIIREKSGLESDGNTLIGSAFGGSNPKIKLNKLKTESEKNIQKGIESILRGIYSAYRNPRSHSKIDDSESDAYEIILFINHLLKLIDKSKGKFSVDIFLDRVFDEDFVQNKKYSDLLVKEVPKGKIFEIAIEIFRKKENGKIHNLKYVWSSINKKLSKEEKGELIDLVSEELRYTNSCSSVIRCIALFENDWDKINEDARLRAENKLIKIIENSKKSYNGHTNESGSYVSWLTLIIDKSSFRDKIATSIFKSLESKDKDKQRFILDYFGHYIDELEKLLFPDSFIELFKTELGDGNSVIYSFVTENFKSEKKQELKDYIDNFVDASQTDELPF